MPIAWRKSLEVVVREKINLYQVPQVPNLME
jgi:hypothetical protein